VGSAEEPLDEPLLRALGPTDEAAALAAHEELAREGFDFLLGWTGQPWPAYLRILDQQRQGRELPPGFVPATFLVAVVGGDLVGRVSIRHDLNEELARVGGHIGYAVRPAFRRRGHATQILRRSLILAGDLGVRRALVTCDDGNLGSALTIERCGGRLESVVPNPGGRPKRRYWIEIS